MQDNFMENLTINPDFFKIIDKSKIFSFSRLPFVLQIVFLDWF